MQIKDARILITGGSLGIGKATASLLVEAGARVAITARQADRLEKAAAAIGAVPIVADAGDPEVVDRTIATAAERLGGLDVLINNAGIGVFKELADVTYDDFATIFRVNVFGPALLAARAAAVFRQQGTHGHIVNVGSTAARKGFAGGTVYAASKFALRGMTECWQAELRRQDIRVTQVDPSEVATAFGRDGQEREAPPNKLSSREIAVVIKSVLELDDRGMVPDLAVWATNPW